MTANNKYLSDYDSTKESNYLMYLDANNLYGYAMSQYLPYKNFKWLDNCDDFNVITVQPWIEGGWRFYEIIFNADITKTYRQIQLNPTHTLYQR